MAYVFELEYGGTSVNLASASGVNHMGYFPQCGTDFTETGTVDESFTVKIHGTNNAGMQVAITALNLAFTMARARQERNAGDRVYINHQPTNYAAEWRSELLDGRLDIVPFERPVIDSAFTIVATITWTRRNWWEGPQANVPLTNGNATDDVAGLKVYFCNDGTGAAGSIHHNYATIDGVNDITGDLPGYGILAAVMAQDTDKLYLSIGPTADAPIHWFESIHTTADATASDGYTEPKTVTAGVATYGTVEVMGTTVTLPSLLPGAVCRMIARLKGNDGSRTAKRIVPYLSAGYGEIVKLPSIYYNLYNTAFDIVPIGASPLGIYKDELAPSTNRDIYWGLEIYSATAGDIIFDFIQIAPAQTVRDYSITGSAAQTLSDDTVADTSYYTYTVALSGLIYAKPSITGSNKILLYPGKDQKLTIIGDTWARDNYCTITLKYRPRRSTL